MESPEVRERRREWERNYEQSTPDERERLIEEWAREQRRFQTVKAHAEQIVEEMFG